MDRRTYKTHSFSRWRPDVDPAVLAVKRSRWPTEVLLKP